MIAGRMCRALLATLALGFGCSALAEDDDLIVTPDEFVYCTVCHGVQMMGNEAIDAPRLSGMDAWYIQMQLESFRNGWRGTHPEDLIGMEMRPMATALTDDLMQEAAEYVSQTISPAPPATIDGDAAAGRRIYASCGACHGANAEGNETLRAPALVGLNDWYLVRQLENYRNGVRGSNPANTYGMQIRAAVQLLGDDKALADVVSYISTLQNN